MLINQPAILPGAFAAGGDKNTIPATNDGLSGLASIEKGFPPICQQPLASGGLPPQRADFNGILYLFSQFLLFAQNGGVYAYNNGLDYQPPCIISYNGEFYSCLQENGPSTSAGVQAPTVAEYWGKLVPVMTGASSSAPGAVGLVPAPAQNQQNYFLTGGGIWQPVATTQQAEAGVDDTAPMTALKVAQAIDALTNAMPVGTILAFAGNTIPEGFLECNGAGISASTYSGLYAVIGNTYGGDSTTFNLPNLTDRFLQGSNTAGTVKAPGLPNITGKVGAPYYAALGSSGAFYPTSETVTLGAGGTLSQYSQIIFNAANSSIIYGQSTTVQPPAVTVRFIIKY